MIKVVIKVIGYRYRHEFGGYQLLVKDWYLCGVRVWRKILDREEIPAWVHIDLCCFGSTTWKSKFKEFIKND